jgi:hypothetical protein
VLFAEAMWFRLRRVCVGELKNITNLSPARASLLGLSLAISCSEKVSDVDLNTSKKIPLRIIFFS